MGGVKKLFQFVVIWLLVLVCTVGVGVLLIPLYYWLVFVGGAARVDKAQQKLQSTLMKDETVLVSG
jgi:hypothetical protein